MDIQENPITVTSPLLPPLKDFVPLLEDIWKRKWITNNGHYHQLLEKSAFRILGSFLHQSVHERNDSTSHGFSGSGNQRLRSNHDTVQFCRNKQRRNQERRGAGLCGHR